MLPARPPGLCGAGLVARAELTGRPSRGGRVSPLRRGFPPMARVEIAPAAWRGRLGGAAPGGSRPLGGGWAAGTLDVCVLWGVGRGGGARRRGGNGTARCEATGPKPGRRLKQA